MIDHLSDPQKKAYAGFRQFVESHVEPQAASWDGPAGIPPETIARVAAEGYLGSFIPPEYGGQGWDYVTFGLLNEAFGYGSASLTGLLTVNAMVAVSILKWGTEAHRKTWLPGIASGETIAAYAITEPGTGSDIRAIQTQFSMKDGHCLLNGGKKWITFAAAADLFLVFGYLEDKPLACIVERNSPGVEVTPITNMLGFKGCHIAEVKFTEVRIPPENLIGKPGFALSFVAPYGLHLGRLSTAWSAAGLLRACLHLSSGYASNRMVNGKRVGDFGTIRKILTETGVNCEAAQLLCLSASRAEDEGAPESIHKTLVAKYFSSTKVVKAASDTVQVLGAAGCNEDRNAARFYRDAKVMEIIEGTTQIHEDLIGQGYLSS